MAILHEIVAHADELLNVRGVRDWPNALNGLQVANSGKAGRIGAAVDAGLRTIEKAAAAGVDLLVVHHGLFWGGVERIEGAFYEKIRLLIASDMAVYSAHLPLDLHPKLGNNALLGKALGFRKTEPFFFEKDQFIGIAARVAIHRDELCRRVEKATGAPARLCPGGPERTGRVGVVTGGAGGEVRKAVEEGVDTLITGEGPHHSYILAEELGINLIYAGHYATETFGVRALAARLGAKYRLPWEFIDHPTGL